MTANITAYSAMSCPSFSTHNLRSKFKASRESFETSLGALLTAEQKAKWETVREMRGMRRHRR